MDPIRRSIRAQNKTIRVQHGCRRYPHDDRVPYQYSSQCARYVDDCVYCLVSPTPPLIRLSLIRRGNSDQMNIAASEAKSTKIRFDGARTLVLLAESGVLYVVIQVRYMIVVARTPYSRL